MGKGRVKVICFTMALIAWAIFMCILFKIKVLWYLYFLLSVGIAS